MRLLVVMFGALLIFAGPLGGQTGADDPYSIQFVGNNLGNALAFPGGKNGSAVKDFQRLGDGVSIALLKILEERDLRNPKTIEGCLSLIRDSFSYPPIISIKVNRKPKVTMFILDYMRRSVSDAETLADIQETIRFVNHKTASIDRSSTPPE